MQFDTTVPIWLQVVRRIKSDIVRGVLQPGDKLPSGRELAVAYTINPNTSARVYQELEAEKLCEVRRGMGTYVTEDMDRICSLRRQMAKESIERFLSELESLGISKEQAVQIILQEDKDDA